MTDEQQSSQHTNGSISNGISANGTATDFSSPKIVNNLTIRIAGDGGERPANFSPRFWDAWVFIC